MGRGMKAGKRAKQGNASQRQQMAQMQALQQQMESDHPGFTRPILFDYRKYNQHLTTGSLLVEVGSHGNTLEQALLSAEWIGDSLGILLNDLRE